MDFLSVYLYTCYFIQKLTRGSEDLFGFKNPYVTLFSDQQGRNPIKHEWHTNVPCALKSKNNFCSEEVSALQMNI